METYEVQSGDCMSSIGLRYGFFWQTLWDLPDNAQLKQDRKDPNVLLVGDQVKIPDKTLKEVDAATEMRHRFRRKGVPAKLRLILKRNGQPRANIHYKLVIDGDLYSGTTGKDGKIEVSIPPDAQKGILTTDDGSIPQQQILNLGHMDPISEISGVQRRLTNLGYDCGGVDGQLSPKTQQALKDFQSDQALQPTGDADDASRNKLKQIYGC